MFPQLFHRTLSQEACGQGIDATADAQHQRLEPGISQAVLDKGHAPGNLGFECGLVLERGLHLELLCNLTLYGLHDSLLAG